MSMFLTSVGVGDDSVTRYSVSALESDLHPQQSGNHHMFYETVSHACVN